MLPVIFAMSQELDLPAVQDSASADAAAEDVMRAVGQALDAEKKDVLVSVPWNAEAAWVARFPDRALAMLVDRNRDGGSDDGGRNGREPRNPALLENAKKLAREWIVEALAEAKGDSVESVNRHAQGESVVVNAEGERPFILVRALSLPQTDDCQTYITMTAWAKNALEPALRKAFGSDPIALTGLRLGAGRRVAHDIGKRWGSFLFDEDPFPGRLVEQPEPLARALASFEAEELQKAANAAAADTKAAGPMGVSKNSGNIDRKAAQAKRKPRTL